MKGNGIDTFTQRNIFNI